MEYLLIVVLGAVCAWLWHKLETLRSDHALLEERLVGLEQRLHSQIERPASTEAATPPVETPALPHADDHARVTGTSPEVSRAAPDTRRPAVSQAVGQAEFEAVSDEDTRSGGFDFEELFGRRLPIWAGGVALAVAGVFMVRWSIERGLLTPEVRVILAFLFGLALDVLQGAPLGHNALVLSLTAFMGVLLYQRIRAVIEADRPFVRSENYVGPCRRRGMKASYDGPFRRHDDPGMSPAGGDSEDIMELSI